MSLARLVIDDLDDLIGQVELAVEDKAVAGRIVDSIEQLHADYLERIRDDLAAAGEGTSRA